MASTDIVHNFNFAVPSILNFVLNNQDLLNKIKNHGCWCSKMDPNRSNVNLGGSNTVDPLDEICKTWSECRHCNDDLTGGECDGIDDIENYYYQIDSQGNCTATDLNSGSVFTDCSMSSCVIDTHYATVIANYITQNLGGNFNNVEVALNDLTTCAEGKSNPLDQNLKICSGEAPFKVIQVFESNSCYCLNGQAHSGECNGFFEFCVSCDPGYYLDVLESKCKEEKICQCDHGNPLPVDQCSGTGAHECQSCGLGYIFSGLECVLKTCPCNNGTPEVGLACNSVAVEQCESCNSGYFLESGFCYENQICECANGTPKPVDECSATGQNECQICDPYYHLDQDENCVENVCVCFSGNAAVGNQGCETHGDTHCLDCSFKPWKRLNSMNTCSDNDCICDHGSVVNQEDCLVHNSNTCQSCDPFYHLDENDDCVENICNCSNGVVVLNSNCSVHEAEQCVSCTSNGYHMSNGACVLNQCVCFAGTPADGSNGCETDGATYCLDCDLVPWKRLNNQNTCSPNTCSCDHGTVVEQEDCLLHNSNSCQSCDNFYHLDSSQDCVENVCTCTNGVPVDNAVCTTHDENQCASCLGNYHLENGTCVENECTCSNGVAIANANCSTDGSEMCGSCTGNYHLENNLCVLNQCNCLSGTAADGSTGCETHDTTHCLDCNTFAWKRLNGKFCVDKDCTCQNGNVVAQTNCVVHNSNTCADCNTGYHLDANQDCQTNVCNCSHGIDATGVDCSSHGANQCTGCDSFYSLNITPIGQCTFQLTVQCEANVCICDRGTPVASGCIQDGLAMCESCDPYHHMVEYLTGQFNCLENVCSCPNGTPVLNSMCNTNGQEQCSACNSGYELENEQCVVSPYTIYYVDANNGDNSYDGLTVANAVQTIRKVFELVGDYPTYIEIQVLNGDYPNWRFGDIILNNPPAVTIQDASYIRLKNFPGHSPRIQFDGSAGILLSNASHVEITGFEIQGEGNNMLLADAESNANAVNSGGNQIGNYYVGRGIVSWQTVGHIHIHDNIIHDAPSQGIRINNGDYITIENNQIYSNTKYCNEARDAVEINSLSNLDDSAAVKIVINNNQIYDNINLIAGNENKVVAGIKFNNNLYYSHGALQISNNEIYNNGVSGINIRDTLRVQILNNEIYSNGQVPTSGTWRRNSNSAGIYLDMISNDIILQNNYVITDLASDIAYNHVLSVDIDEENSYDNFACVGSISSAYGDYVNQQYTGCENRHATYTTYYADAINGNDSNDGLTIATAVKNIRNIFQNKVTEPAQFVEVLVLDGTYSNFRFGQGHPNSGGFSNPPVVKINEGSFIKISNYPGHSPKIEFDGSAGFMFNNCSFVEVSGFEIEGQNQVITQAEAEANRLIQDTYFSGRGIVAWSGHNYYFHHNNVHDCPNSGIRTNKGDYNRIEHNQVYRNTWWSSNAESGIVFADSRSLDTYDGIKMTIKNNLVYENINKIPYYNSNYDDPQYLIDNQMSVAREHYGSILQDFIIDGSGVYITRNSEYYTNGRFELSNNEAYLNGINGVVVHKTDRAWVHHNQIYNNGQVPKSVPESRQPYAGLVINTGTDVTLHDNTVTTQLADDYAFIITGGVSTFNMAESGDNYACVGLVDSDFGSTVSVLPSGCEVAYANVTL